MLFRSGKTDRVARLVVDRDRNVNELQGGVGVAESNDWDVDVGRLADGLVVNAGVGDDDEAGLLEGASNVVGKTTRSETASNCLRASVCGVLKDSTVTVRASGDDTNVVRVLNGGDDTGSKNKLLPSLADVDDMDT